MDEEQHRYKEQGCDDEPTSEKITEESSLERDSNQEKKPTKSLLQQWCDLEIDKRIESAVAVVGLLIGIFVAYVALNQLSAMKEQTEAMKSQLTEMQNGGAETKNLIAATEKIAEATKSSVAQSKVTLDTTIEASRLDQRAWVGVIAAKSPHVRPGAPVGLEVEYVNTGKTPARKFMGDIAVRYQPTNQKFTPHFTKPTATPSTVIILPQMRVSSQASRAGVILTQEELNGVMAGTAVLYVFGKFTYRTLNIDAGGTFCMYFQRDLNSPPGWCDTYNDVY